MSSCTIYMATHKPTQKSYIGITSNLEARKICHKYDSSSPIHRLILSDEADCFEWKILADNLKPQKAIRLEIELIRKQNTLHPNGLNRGLIRCGLATLKKKVRKIDPEFDKLISEIVDEILAEHEKARQLRRKQEGREIP